MITIAWPLGEVLLATVVAMEFSPRAIGPDAAIESCLPGWEVPPRDGTNSARMVTLGVPAEPKEKAASSLTATYEGVKTVPSPKFPQSVPSVSQHH